MTCSKCGREALPQQKFCSGCGSRLPEAPPPTETGQPASCGACGSVLTRGAKFCSGCGQPVGASRLSAPGPGLTHGCRACGSALVPGARFCSVCGVPVAAPASASAVVPVSQIREDAVSATVEPWWSPPAFNAVPPPPPASGQAFHFRSSPATVLSGAAKEFSSGSPTATERARQNLPPSGHYWSFQDETTNAAAQVISKLNESGFSTQSGFGRIVGRMIRGALLDKIIYREVAADGMLQAEAWKVTGLIIVLGSIGFSLLSPSYMSLSGLMALGSIAIIQLIAWLARVWVVQVAAYMWLQKQTTFEQLFRALAYAQSPAILQIIPVVGPAVGLWCIVTNTAAIRDVTGCDTWNAAILAIVGVVGVMVATAFAGPIVQTQF